MTTFDDLEAALPEAAPCGSQTMSAEGGGGGACWCVATSWTVEQVVTVFTAAKGPATETGPGTAAWRFRSTNGSEFIHVWTPGAGTGGAPGFRPDLVPLGARAVVAFGYAYFPRPGASGAAGGGGDRRRWWRRRRT